MRTSANSTAGNVALLRAARQVLEGGSIFPDPFAIPILGQSVETLREVRGLPEFIRLLRLFVASRSGFSEDRLGVVPYLSRDAIFATLSSIANVPDAEVGSTMGSRRRHIRQTAVQAMRP